MSREVRSYDYVNRPYDEVCEALQSGAVALFRAATKAASARAESVAVDLRVSVAGIEVGREIAITVHEIEERPREATSPPVTRLELEWEAAESPRLFPFMKAELSVYPLTPTETQLAFSGHYEPPFGVLGGAINALVGHRIAEASVHRFLSDVGTHLRTSLESS
jgi:hypothetical protein